MCSTLYYYITLWYIITLKGRKSNHDALQRQQTRQHPPPSHEPVRLPRQGNRQHQRPRTPSHHREARQRNRNGRPRVRSGRQGRRVWGDGIFGTVCLFSFGWVRVRHGDIVYLLGNLCVRLSAVPWFGKEFGLFIAVDCVQRVNWQARPLRLPFFLFFPFLFALLFLILRRLKAAQLMKGEGVTQAVCRLINLNFTQQHQQVDKFVLSRSFSERARKSAIFQSQGETGIECFGSLCVCVRSVKKISCSGLNWNELPSLLQYRWLCHQSSSLCFRHLALSC